MEESKHSLFIVIIFILFPIIKFSKQYAETKTLPPYDIVKLQYGIGFASGR